MQALAALLFTWPYYAITKALMLSVTHGSFNALSVTETELES
jgi:hypothetical protein